MFFNPPSIEPAGVKGVKAGILVESEFDVRRKESRSLAWFDVDSGDSFYLDDQVFTGENAKAKIKLENGSFLDIAENSLVKIEAKQATSTVKVTKGFLLAKLGSEGSLKINIGNQDLNLSSKGAAVQITGATEGTNPEVAVLVGEASIELDGRNLALTSDNVLNIDESGKTALKKIQVKLLSPDANSVIFIDKGPITFRWKSGEGYQKFRLLLSRSSNFHANVQTHSTKQERLSLTNLASGTYFFKVEAYDETSKTWHASLRRQIEVAKLEAPVLKTPRDLSTVQGNRVVLTWRSGKEFRRHEWQIATDQNFSSLVRSAQTSSQSTQLVPKPNTQYYWRVRSVQPKQTPWSKTFSFKTTGADLSPPELLAPANRTNIASKEMKSKTEFSWRPVDGASAYTIELSSSPDFSQIAVSKTVKGSIAEILVPKAKTIYWRVTASSGKVHSKPSTVRTIQPGSGEATKLSPQSDKKYELNKGEAIPITWKAAAKSMMLVIATDRALQNAVVKTKTTSGYQFKPQKTSTYYWAIADDLKSIAADKPYPFSVKLKTQLKPPVLARRYYLEIPWR